MRFSMAATPLSFTEQQRHPFLKSVTKYYAQYSLIISTYALWGRNFGSNQLVRTPAKLCYRELSNTKYFPRITWVQAIRCMSRPPLWPPCFSHLHSHSLSQTIVDEVVEYLTALADGMHPSYDAHLSYDAHVNSPNSLRMTAIFFPCWVVRMWVNKVVLPAPQWWSFCFGYLHIGIWERVWSLIRFVVLTWAQLASYDSDRNLEKCNFTHTTRNYS